MPHYEFVCNACKKTFTKTLTVAEHDAKTTTCPDCGSRRRPVLVNVLCCHLEKECLNPVIRARRVCTPTIFPFRSRFAALTQHAN